MFLGCALRTGLTDERRARRDLHVVPGLLQERFGGIVVEIKSLRRLIRTRCCCEPNHRSGRETQNWIFHDNGVDQRLFALPILVNLRRV